MSLLNKKAIFIRLLKAYNVSKVEKKKLTFFASFFIFDSAYNAWDSKVTNFNFDVAVDIRKRIVLILTVDLKIYLCKFIIIYIYVCIKRYYFSFLLARIIHENVYVFAFGSAYALRNLHSMNHASRRTVLRYSFTNVPIEGNRYRNNIYYRAVSFFSSALIIIQSAIRNPTSVYVLSKKVKIIIDF